MSGSLSLASAASAIETVALRFGGFYGPQVASTDDLVRQIRAGRAFAPAGASGLMPFIHIEDAVAATVAAAELVSWRIPLSNTRARTELGWSPAYATVRAGWRGLAQERQAA